MTEPKVDQSSWKQVSNAIDGIYQQLAVSENNGTVKFLKFGPNKAYPKHHHPDRVEWLYVLSGGMTVEIDGEVRRMEEGEYAYFPINSQHSLEAGGKGATVVVAAFIQKT